jgi:hypothetical protein
LDYNDNDEEWAWNFIVDGQSLCVTGNTGDSMPWEQKLNWQADVTTQSSQLTLKIDAWEKDAAGELCVWANGDDPSQRVQSEIGFPPMATGNVIVFTKTLTFANRDMPWDAYCTTTVEGYVTKLASTTLSVTLTLVFFPLLPASSCSPSSSFSCNLFLTLVWLGCGGRGQQDGLPRITAATITLVNGVPQLRITGKDLNPDSQELPVVQVTGGGTTSGCIASSIRASGTQTRQHTCQRGVLQTLFA